METITSQLAARIGALLSAKERVIVAIDGMAASGKTTLAAALLKQFPGSACVHMDDFTIPLDARYPGYFDAELSNADIARFDSEVLTPLLEGRNAHFRPYVCHPTAGFLDPVKVPASAQLVIVEGAYCLHPRLFDRYDLRVLSLVDQTLQKERILLRSGAAQLERFEALWIPLELRHIVARRLEETCDMTLFTDRAP